MLNLFIVILRRGEITCEVGQTDVVPTLELSASE
jgi:hypothetical protein